ncbi:MAG: response regulator [Acidobacteria bacterium]|nr:MAG: response regulator [Acidobacteriota bacterium]
MSKELVLMVDDELDNRVMMRYFLESWGYEVDLAENGQEALDKVDEKRPSLILLDLEMPVLNGFETCERLKENPDTEDIPIIMFTGLEATSDKVRGINGGADDYVVKTVDPEEIQARIEMILRRTKRYEQKAKKAQAASTNSNGDGNGNGSQKAAVLSGSLEEKNFPEAFQLAMAYGQSGTMVVKDGDKIGRVYLVDGDAIHAEYDGRTGEEAFYAMSVWKHGQFSYQVEKASSKRTIQAKGQALLMEATRRLDEWNLISAKIPNFDVTPHRIASGVTDTIKFNKMDWKILSHVDGKRSIRQVSEATDVELFEVARTVFGLLTAGVLAFEAEKLERDTFFDAVPELRDEPKNKEFELTAIQWKLLAYIDGKRDLGTLTQLVGLSPHKMAKALKTLAELGFLRVGKARSKTEGGNGKTTAPKNGRDHPESINAGVRAAGLD